MPLLPGGPQPMGMGGAPALPKSPLGGPAGPGASPAMSPGAGAGNEAAAIADIKTTLPILLKSISAFKIGDKRRKPLLRAIESLEAAFGGSRDEDLTGAAVQRLGAAAKGGQGLQGHNMPPPGMQLGGPSPGGGMGGMPGGM